MSLPDARRGGSQRAYPTDQAAEVRTRALACAQAVRLALRCGSYLLKPAIALACFIDRLRAALNTHTCQIRAVYTDAHKSAHVQMVITLLW